MKIEKTFEGKRPRTWVAMTKRGKGALDSELQALREIMDRVNGNGRITKA